MCCEWFSGFSFSDCVFLWIRIIVFYVCVSQGFVLISDENWVVLVF